MQIKKLSDERKFIALLSFIVISFGVLYHVMNPTVFFVTATVANVAAIVGLLPMFISGNVSREAKFGILAFMLLILVPTGATATHLDWGMMSRNSLILLSALAFVFVNYAIFVPLALFDERNGNGTPYVQARHPSVSIIVPANNDENIIQGCLQSLQELDYPDANLEIAVVDDGSSDGTVEEARRVAGKSTRILEQSSDGIHSALNHGLEHVSGEIVLTIDPDTVLEPDALNNVVGAFQANPDVSAIAGRLRVENQHRFIAKLQQLEYVVGIHLPMRAYNVLEAVTVDPGAFGAFRRECFEWAEFEGDTLAVERDITVQILRNGLGIRATDATGHTKAPETSKDLLRQRGRWYRGLLQTLGKHRGAFHRPEYGKVFRFGFAGQVVGAFALPIAGIVILASAGAEMVAGSPSRVLAILSIFGLLQMLVSLLGCSLEEVDQKLALLGPLFVVGYRQFLDTIMLKSVFDVLLGRDIERTDSKRPAQIDQVTEEPEIDEAVTTAPEIDEQVTQEPEVTEAVTNTSENDEQATEKPDTDEQISAESDTDDISEEPVDHSLETDGRYYLAENISNSFERIEEVLNEPDMVNALDEIASELNNVSVRMAMLEKETGKISGFIPEAREYTPVPNPEGTSASEFESVPNLETHERREIVFTDPAEIDRYLDLAQIEMREEFYRLFETLCENLAEFKSEGGTPIRMDPGLSLRGMRNYLEETYDDDISDLSAWGLNEDEQYRFESLAEIFWGNRNAPNEFEEIKAILPDDDPTPLAESIEAGQESEFLWGNISREETGEE